MLGIEISQPLQRQPLGCYSLFMHDMYLMTFPFSPVMEA